MWLSDSSKLVMEGDKLWERMILMRQLSSAEYRFDQQLLTSVIFHPVSKNILAFDSSNCVNWSNFAEVPPFKVSPAMQRTLWGIKPILMEMGINGKHGIVDCRIECRPSNGLDWIYCLILILFDALICMYVLVCTQLKKHFCFHHQ